nr:integrase, catalytic region, zinc finger, CCHC-type, peptidase aspartic, catalytic [Tanacetum cinerariifolium]
MENVLQENYRLLTQALSVEIVNIVVHENMKSVCLNVTACARCVTTETELKTEFLNNECYDMLLQKYHTLEKHCITLEAQAKDTVILKLKEKLNSLNGDVKDRDVKRNVEDMETLNIELDHKCDDLIKKVNLKSAEVSDLNARLQEKVFVITALKEQLDKLKGKAVVQIVLWYLDSGCSKHMIGDRSQLVNFVQKFLGTVKFGNDHVAKIMGYGDYQIGNVTISWVYYVEGLSHNFFSVGQFYDSDLEVAFRQHTCFIRNLDR